MRSFNGMQPAIFEENTNETNREKLMLEKKIRRKIRKPAKRLEANKLQCPHRGLLHVCQEEVDSPAADADNDFPAPLGHRGKPLSGKTLSPEKLVPLHQIQKAPYLVTVIHNSFKMMP